MYDVNNACFQRHSVDFGAASKAANYDCVDGVACNNYMNCRLENLQYNVPNNRYPIPFNLTANFPPTSAPQPYLNGGMSAACNHGQYYSSNHHQPYYGQQQRSSMYPPHSQEKHRSSEIYQNYDHTAHSRKKHDTGVDYEIVTKMQNHHLGEDLIYIDTRDEVKKAAKRNERHKSKIGELLHDYQEETEKHARNSRHSDFDSYDEVAVNQQRRQSRVSNKNQDGIGSYESWNYVFQNLEKQGYSKDLGERGDIRGDEVDYCTTGTNTQTYQNGHEAQHTMKSTKTTKTRSSENKLKTLKSAEKVDGIRSSSMKAPKKANSQPPMGTTTKPSNGILVKKKATTFDLSQPKEWSCKFCTFLNPETMRICEMCSKSRDFNMDNEAATCV
jgi:spermatogenesis-associated protein 2